MHHGKHSMQCFRTNSQDISLFVARILIILILKFSFSVGYLDYVSADDVGPPAKSLQPFTELLRCGVQVLCCIEDQRRRK